MYIYIYNPPCNFLYKIATVKLGNMVRFRALLCLGVPTQCQHLRFYRGPWCQRLYRDFMLKTGWHWNLEQERLEYSGQLSMNETWGIWFYRRPTNPPDLKKALREWLGVSYSIENDAHKQPQWQQFYRDCQLENILASLILQIHYQKEGQRLQVYHYKIAHTNTSLNSQGDYIYIYLVCRRWTEGSASNGFDVV